MEIRVFNRTAEMQAYEVTASVSGVEILGIRFGFSSRDLDWHTDNDMGELLANGVYLYQSVGEDHR